MTGSTCHAVHAMVANANELTTYQVSARPEEVEYVRQPPPSRAAARCRGGLAAGFRGDRRAVSAFSATPVLIMFWTPERVRIHPFNLRDRARHQVVIDRLAYWYYHPREWLKKVALMDDVYLMNSPFTFQSMEKHSAYCALIRLGMNVPDTVLVPYKNPIDNVRWAYTSRNYNDPFDLVAIADEMGYPLFMKPFDGGGWRGCPGSGTRPN